MTTGEYFVVGALCFTGAYYVAGVVLEVLKKDEAVKKWRAGCAPVGILFFGVLVVTLLLNGQCFGGRTRILDDTYDPPTTDMQR